MKLTGTTGRRAVRGNWRPRVVLAIAGLLIGACVGWAELQVHHAGPVLPNGWPTRWGGVRPAPFFPGLSPPAATSTPDPSVILNTDSDAEARIQRTIGYLREGRETGDYEAGATLAQIIIDQHGTTLTQYGKGLYWPANRMAERLLLGFHRDDARVLRHYRIKADASAKGLLGGEAEGSTDLAKLGEVTQRYFLSSVGDEAAYMRACLLLDRGRHAEAAALLGRVWAEYPDPTVDREALLLRWTVALARSGDPRRAGATLARLREIAGDDASSVRVAYAAVNAAASARPPKVNHWAMRGGQPGRGGVMPEVVPLSDATDRSGLVTNWSDTFRTAAPAGYWGGPSFRLQSSTQSVTDLLARSRAHGWLPVGEVLHDEKRLYYRTHEALVCRDRSGGQVRWTADRPEEQYSSPYANRSHNHNHVPYPWTAEEVLAFEDELGKRMTLIDGVIYCVERNDMAAWMNGATTESMRNQNMPLGNQLVARDAETGALRWSVGRQLRPNLDAGLEAVRFLAPPVKASGRLLTLVERNRDILLVGIEPKTGELAFERLLCEVETFHSPWWSAAAIAVADSQVLCLFGRGVVVSASAEDGRVDWIRTYERGTARSHQHHNQTQQPIRQQGIGGWPSNGLFIDGSIVAATPYDAESILLLDRRTGRSVVVADHADRGDDESVDVDEPSHVLGVHDGRLVVATEDGLAAYEMADGRLAWRAGGVEPTGTAAMTDSAIFVPTGHEILWLDPHADGKRVAVLEVRNQTEQPVGNLYSTGEDLAVFGVGRVWGLTRPSYLLAQLNQRIARRPRVEDYRRRAELRMTLGKVEAGLADYRRAIQASGDDRARDEARTALAGSLQSLAWAEPAHEDAAAWLKEAASLVPDSPWLAGRIALTRARHLEAVGSVGEAARVYQRLVAERLTSRDAERLAGLWAVEVSDQWGARQIPIAREALDGLRRLAGDQRVRVASALQVKAEGELAEAMALLAADRSIADKRAGFNMLQRLPMLYPGTAASIRAIERIGEHDAQVGLEAPRHVLTRLADDEDEAVAAKATAALAKLYTQAGWLAEARHWWRQLGDRFEERSLVWGGEPVTALALGDRMLDELGVGDLAPPHRTPEGPWKQQWTLDRRAMFMRLTGDARSALHREHVLLFNSAERTLSCYPLDGLHEKGQPAWVIRDPAFSRISRNPPDQLHFAGLMSDHMLLTWHDEEARVYGLSSGKLLWSIDRPDVLDTRNYIAASQAIRDRGFAQVAIDDRIVAWVETGQTGQPTLVVRDAVSGDVLWSRTHDAGIDGVAITDDYVVMISGGGAMLRSLDRRTGEPVAEATLDQSPNRLRWASNHALTQYGSQLHCVDLGDGGVAWREQIYGWGQSHGFGVMHNGMVWLQTNQYILKVRDLAEGGTAYTGSPPPQTRTRHYLMDAALSPDGGTFVAVWRNSSNAEFSAQFIDRATGGERTVELGRGSGQPPLADALATSAGPIPWADRERQGNRYTGKYAVEFISRETAKPLEGPKLPTPEGEGRIASPNFMPEVIGRCVVITDHRQTIVFGSDDSNVAAGP